MADKTFMINVPENTEIKSLADQLAQLYIQKGFGVNVVEIGDNVQLTFDKGVGGINMLLGMGLGIKATISIKGNMLTVIYSDAEWTGKIIGLAVGWFICLVPFITAIIGSVNQNNLPKQINNDITMLASNYQINQN